MRPKFPNESFDDYIKYMEGYNEGFADGYSMTIDQIKDYDLVSKC